MPNTHPKTTEISRALTPWFPTFISVAQSAESKVLQANGVLGLARPGERAGDFHRALRTNFRAWCEETNGLFEMIEERDGLGLDAIRAKLIDGKSFLIRFGRLNGDRVRRNDSIRQTCARSFGVLSSEFLIPGIDEQADYELTQVTLVYTISEVAKGTIGGVPSWHMASLHLIQEKFDGFDRLADIAKFSPPTSIIQDGRRAVAVPNEEELEEWRRQIRRAQRNG